MSKDQVYEGYASIPDVDSLKKNKHVVLEDLKDLPKIEEILKKFGTLEKRPHGSFFAESTFFLKKGSLRLRVSYCDKRFNIVAQKTDKFKNLTHKHERNFEVCSYYDFVSLEKVEPLLKRFFLLFKRKTPKRIKEARRQKFEQEIKGLKCKECEYYGNCYETYKDCKNYRPDLYD